MNTSGRVAIVTGGGRGIGEAISKRLAAEGYPVGVLDMDVEAAEATAADITAAGGVAAAVAANVADEESVGAAVERVAETLGAPTILINNAGVLRDAMLFKMTVDQWDTVMSVHLRGAFLMTKATQKYMVEAKFGRVVSMSSTAALGNRGQANYSTAKAGLQGFTKTAAIELGPFGVTVNTIAPGFIVSEMTKAAAEGRGLTLEEFIDLRSKELPVRRVGYPEDVADLVNYLVSEGAGFLSGQVIYLAGGPRV